MQHTLKLFGKIQQIMYEHALFRYRCPFKIIGNVSYPFPGSQTDSFLSAI